MRNRAETIEFINQEVTFAIHLAESDEIFREGKTIEAYQIVCFYEEWLSMLLDANTVEGGIARAGAIRAAMQAGQGKRAIDMAEAFLREDELSSSRRREIQGLLNTAKDVVSLANEVANLKEVAAAKKAASTTNV